MSDLRADQLGYLGTAGGFAVLGATAVTNTGVTVLTGDLGVSGGAITGFPPGTVTGGSTYVDNAVTAQAHANAMAGYNSLTALMPTGNLTGQDLGGLTLTPGVYTFASSADLTGVLTLNFGGASNESFVFETGSTLTTATGAVVNVINQGSNDSVYFAVGSSATIGAGSDLQGYLLAQQSITLGTGAEIVDGSALALNGAVTLQGNTVTAYPAVGSVVTPEPGSFVLVGSGLVVGFGVVRRRVRV